MTISVKHAFVSAKADGTDDTLVRPSNWNDDHNITLATGNLMGRQSAGTGDVEEIPCSAAAASMLNQADIAAICAYLGLTPNQTGDARLTMSSSVPTGWVMMNDGTIGNATSGASTRANADTQDLFNLLYPFADADCPLFTSSGSATTRAAQGNVATAYAAGCRMSLPKQLGRTFIIAGAGAGLTSRALGHPVGSEAIALQRSDLPNVTATVDIHDPGHAHSHNAQAQTAGGGPGPQGNVNVPPAAATINAAFTGITATINLNGNVTQTSPSIIPPANAWNVLLKL